VHCSARTLQELPATGQPATLAIETHVREDQIRLFGFLTEVERNGRLAQTVQGVGARSRLGAGNLRPADLASAIAMRDKAMVARAPSAQRWQSASSPSSGQGAGPAGMDPSWSALRRSR
jgi:Holliday junction DNA helicase RuvA